MGVHLPYNKSLGAVGVHLTCIKTLGVVGVHLPYNYIGCSGRPPTLQQNIGCSGCPPTLQQRCVRLSANLALFSCSLSRLKGVKNKLKHDKTYLIMSILIGYYTVDSLYLTSAQMTSILEEPIGESNMVKLSGHEFKCSSVLYSQLYNYLLLYIQLFK